MREKYTVWVGGGEITDYLLTEVEAQAVAYHWQEQGYSDVVVEKVDQ